MKYKKGDIVGICSDCMAEFEITMVFDGTVSVDSDGDPIDKNKKGYEAKCILLHHPNPKKSVLKLGQTYFTTDKQIVVKLREVGEKRKTSAQILREDLGLRRRKKSEQKANRKSTRRR